MSGAAALRRQLEERFPGCFTLDVGAGGMVLLTVVDPSFEGQSRVERRKRMVPLLEAAGLKPGILELYTQAEADARGLTLPARDTPVFPPASWEAAVEMVESGKGPIAAPRDRRRPRRVVFYSYKGGVGRTTALIQTAFHLARAHQRVALVDMDVEAPGLHAVLPPPDGILEAGLVDYLWERQVRPAEAISGEAPEIKLERTEQGRRKGIVYTVEDPDSREQLFIVPAGRADASYVRRLSVLSAQEISTSSNDPWTLFEKELVAHFEPDVLLIDARTGLSDWGGLSLLRLADEVFLVMYPSAQNAEGVRFVRTTLRELRGTGSHTVLSPLPEGKLGLELVERIKPELDLEEDESPLQIYYNPSIAAASRFPVESAMADYARLANLLLESGGESRVEETILQLDRWKIVDSLQFPERDAKSIVAQDFEQLFQKTSDFEKLLDDARWVVRGRKGTGKSTLYHLFTEHKENAATQARGKLEGIEILSGHGPANTLRPTTDHFDQFQRELSKGQHDWLSFWRAYAVVRLHVDGAAHLESVLKRPSMRPLREHLERVFPRNLDKNWESAQSKGLVAIVRDQDLNMLGRDLMSGLNRALAGANRKVWLLYDDLDQDLQEDRAWQADALGGLLRLVYDLNNQDLHQIRFKIFLREDLWQNLVFTNKSHFGDARTLLLRWEREDFLRLAYRLAIKGSQEFRALAQRTLPLPEREVDLADEETLRQALAPLWGMHQEKGKKAYAARWVYSRMTDASDNTYPRSLTILLNAAKLEELRGRSSKQTQAVPDDRLLSPRAMKAGLKAASVERCDALKNEYPKLKPLLDSMRELRSQFKDAELKRLWERTARKAFPRYDTFVKQLESIGLLERKEESKEYDYGIASLYIDGLAVKRIQGETK